MKRTKIWKKIPKMAQLRIIESAKTEFNIDFKVSSFFQKLFGQTNLTEENLKLIFNVKELNLSGCKKVTDLNFIVNFERVKDIYIGDTNVTDITPLRSLPLLEKIYASGTRIKSYKPLKDSKITLLYSAYSNANDFHYLSNITSLEVLELSENIQLESLEVFENLSELKKLHIDHTSVKSLRPILNLKKLEEVYCLATPIPINEKNFFNLNNKSGIIAQDWI